MSSLVTNGRVNERIRGCHNIIKCLQLLFFYLMEIY